MNTDNFVTAGKFLFDQYNANKEMEPLPKHIHPESIEEAYSIQHEYLSLLSQTYGQPVGHKLAYTTNTMQERAGLTEPCAGIILGSTVYQSPAVLKDADYVKLGIECEIAVILGGDITPAASPHTIDSVGGAIECIMPAFEVVDFRTPDLQGMDRALTAISTNISNAGVILGDAIYDWQNLDLRRARGEMFINGESVGYGTGADIMGHPFAPLVWLANKFSAENKTIAASSVIITGSIVTPKYLSKDDSATITITNLGEAHLSVG